MQNEIPNLDAFKNAFKELKKSKAWRGSIDERKAKFKTAHDTLNQTYGRDLKLLFVDVSAEFDAVQGASGFSGYSEQLNAIVIVHKLSVITFMQLWLIALGIEQISAVEFSKNLFNEIFPRSAKNLVMINGLLVKADASANNDASNDNINDLNGQ